MFQGQKLAQIAGGFYIQMKKEKGVAYTVKEKRNDENYWRAIGGRMELYRA